MGKSSNCSVTGRIHNEMLIGEMKIKGVTVDEVAEEMHISVFEVLKRLNNRLPREMKIEMLNAINSVFFAKIEERKDNVYL